MSTPMQAGSSSGPTKPPTTFFSLPGELRQQILNEALVLTEPPPRPSLFVIHVGRILSLGIPAPGTRSEIEELSATVMSLLAIMTPEHYIQVATALRINVLEMIASSLIDWDMKTQLMTRPNRGSLIMPYNQSPVYPNAYEDYLRSFARGMAHLMRYTEILDDTTFKYLMQRAERPEELVDIHHTAIHALASRAFPPPPDHRILTVHHMTGPNNTSETRTVTVSRAEYNIFHPNKAIILLDFERAMLMLDYNPYNKKVRMEGVRYMRDLYHDTSVSYLLNGRLRRQSLLFDTEAGDFIFRGWD